jgi:hypothetical protein
MKARNLIKAILDDVDSLDDEVVIRMCIRKNNWSDCTSVQSAPISHTMFVHNSKKGQIAFWSDELKPVPLEE